MLRSLRGALGLEQDRIVDGLRRALEPYHPVDDLSNAAIVDAYFSEVFAPGSELGRIADAARDSMGEIAALQPAFVVSTGDLVAQSGRGSAASLEAWLRFYREITEATGLRFYNTLGAVDSVSRGNGADGEHSARVGEQLFHDVYGPSHYSFDHSNFHFVALDADSREWLAADLSVHPDMVYVGLGPRLSHALPRPALQYALTSYKGTTTPASHNGTTMITTGSLAGGRWVPPPELRERGYACSMRETDSSITPGSAPGSPCRLPRGHPTTGSQGHLCRRRGRPLRKVRRRGGYCRRGARPFRTVGRLFLSCLAPLPGRTPGGHGNEARTGKPPPQSSNRERSSPGLRLLGLWYGIHKRDLQGAQTFELLLLSAQLVLCELVLALSTM